MAVIGKIRQRSGLLIIIIGASIVGFLIMDATNSQSSVLRGRQTNIAKVDGEKISYNEFEKKYEDNVKNVEMQYSNSGMSLSQSMRDDLRNQTYNDLVNEKLFDKVYSRLGIAVTDAEFAELAVGENVHPYIRQNFSNPQTGQFDPQYVQNFLRQKDQDQPNDPEPGRQAKLWDNLEQAVRKDEYRSKYEALISKSLYAPTWMAEMTYNDQARTVDVKYVQLPYGEINDADIKVTDEDLQAYLDGHQSKFKQDEETRKIDYVLFPIEPSATDTANTLTMLEEKRADFAKGKTISEDSIFSKLLYPNVPFDEVYYDREALEKKNSPIKDSLFSLPVKSIIGPYLENGSYKLAKIIDRKMVSDSLHLRQIKISFEGITTNEAGIARRMFADSIFRVIDSLKQDFGLMAMQFSDDPISKLKGGDMGWVKQGEKAADVNNLLFYRGVKGKTYQYGSQEDNAMYIVQIVEDRPSKMGVLAAYMSKEVVPGQETEHNIYDRATSFAAENQTAEKFTAAGKKINMRSADNLQPTQFSVPGIGSCRDLVKWVFEAKKGDVSPTFAPEKKYVVALVSAVRPKGTPTVDQVRDQLRGLVLTEKKYEILAKKITAAKANTIEETANKLGKPVENASKVAFFTPALGNGYEPNVVAAAFVSAPGKVSGPVKGNAGAYVVQTTAVQEAPKIADYSLQASQLKQMWQRKAEYRQTDYAAEVQKKLAKIDDHRAEFF